MADGGAPSAASQRLVELLARGSALEYKKRYESAAAKALEAVALARQTTPPHSLLRAYALVRHAMCVKEQQRQVHARGGNNTAVDRATYAAEQALCAVSYASLLEALPILFARAEANTLLPGCVPADEEESYQRLVLLIVTAEAAKGDDDLVAAVSAALVAGAHSARHGQRLGYQVFLQAACTSFYALYASFFVAPFPPLLTDDDNAKQTFDLLSNCVLQVMRWMGANAGPSDDAGNGVQWHLTGFHCLAEENKLCDLISMFLETTEEQAQQLIRPDLLRCTLKELWNSPQLANRRRRWAETSPVQSQLGMSSRQRAAADVARLGLAKCANAGCSAMESCPKAFKTCGRCHSVVYCGRDCQLAAWPSHKHDCKRIDATRRADLLVTEAVRRVLQRKWIETSMR